MAFCVPISLFTLNLWCLSGGKPSTPSITEQPPPSGNGLFSQTWPRKRSHLRNWKASFLTYCPQWRGCIVYPLSVSNPGMDKQHILYTVEWWRQSGDLGRNQTHGRLRWCFPLLLSAGARRTRFHGFPLQQAARCEVTHRSRQAAAPCWAVEVSGCPI